MKKDSFLAKIARQKTSYLFIALPVTLFFVFQLAPVFISFIWSFTTYDVVHFPKFVGLANYKTILFDDPLFWKAMGNTVIYTVGVVPVGICLSLVLAVAIDQKIKFKNLFKSIFFLPTVTAIVAVSVIWKWLYAGEKYGLFNYFLLKIGFQPIDWLASPTWILPSIMIMSVWAGLGYNMIIFLAGLQTIPGVMYEAAEIDGAGFWHKFVHITLPLLKPTLVFVTMMSFIFSFQVFEQVYVMTGGQGGIGGVLNSGLTIVAYLYDKGFQKFQMGYASALAYIIFIFIFLLTVVNKRLMKTNVEY
ncbi:MAG: sugar ABC transporter permease [Candidatus Omnitrophica bacterium]|jgi:multiple sugar transport system permease protein|nr:sugar ABC transporter permease [Candidatus Omnitrophota bacterium]MDD4012945.1 sugar ABC transporter permease [Candidatus Omnitrophota bacterium]